jgi:hypothetical protein
MTLQAHEVPFWRDVYVSRVQHGDMDWAAARHADDAVSSLRKRVARAPDISWIGPYR